MMNHAISSHTKILIIDKSTRYAYNIVQQLKASSLQHPSFPKYDVKVASTGLDALLILNEFQPDCILLSYELPDMAGLEFLDLLADVRSGITMPFLLLVEQSNEMAVTNMMKHNVDEFLVKGEFDAFQLTWTICCTLERAKLQAQLYRKHEELKIFADRMAHDLLVSLSKLSLCTEYLEMNTEAEAIRNTEQQYALSAITESIDQTINLVESFRDYAHVERMNINFSHVNLNSIVAHILLDLQSEIDDLGAQILVDSLPTVIGDPVGLGQLLHMLIVQAMKSGNASPSPSIHIQATRADTAWQISITEHNANNLDSNTYVRGQETEDLHTMHRNGAQNGAGADLNEETNGSSRSKDPDTEIKIAICRKIVELHSGTIGFRSLPTGGTICCFTIEKNLKTTNRSEPRDAFDDIALSNRHYSFSATQSQDAV